MELKKILLVDDDEAFNFLNRIVFTDNNVNCLMDEVMDGKAALDYLQQSNACPDVILLDINMPVMDGFEFLEQFENYSKCSAVSKVFILTSSHREEDRQKSLANKYVKGYFDKPLNSSHVKQILAAIDK
jgi:CheY-like chemotaxis protein